MHKFNRSINGQAEVSHKIQSHYYFETGRTFAEEAINTLAYSGFLVLFTGTLLLRGFLTGYAT